MAQTQQYQTRVVTDKARLSHVHVFKAHKDPTKRDATPKYKVTILLPKSDFATKQRIDFAIGEAIKRGAAEFWGGVVPPLLAICIHDGDGPRPSDGMQFDDCCKGHWVFTASADPEKFKPEVVDATGNPILDQSEVYSGCYGRVSVNFFPYLNNGKKGIGCGLGNIQKLADGEPLAGGRSAAQDFGPPQGQPGASPAGFPTQGYGSPMPGAMPGAYPATGYNSPAPPVPGQYGGPVNPVPGYAAPVTPGVVPGQPAANYGQQAGQPAANYGQQAGQNYPQGNPGGIMGIN